MNGVHDMGGMQGAGLVVPERDEPVFHEAWEKHVFALQIATSCQGLYNRDEFRHAIERLPWGQYLESSYYERWLAAMETLLREKGVIDAEELETRVEYVKEHSGALAPFPASTNPGQLAGRLAQIVRAGASSRRETGQAPRFKPGDAVAVRNIHPATTRACPGTSVASEGQSSMSTGPLFSPIPMHMVEARTPSPSTRSDSLPARSGEHRPQSATAST